MRLSALPVRDHAKLVFGALGLWYALERWFLDAPRLSGVRICGNCLMASVGVPIEIGLVGLLLVVAVLLRIPVSRTGATDWTLTAVGILLTPLLIGIPVFSIGYLSLVLSHANDWNPRRT